MPGKSKEGGGLESSPVYKKSAFTMRSGNSPLFKTMGSSPMNHKKTKTVDVPHEHDTGGSSSKRKSRKPYRGSIPSYGGNSPALAKDVRPGHEKEEKAKEVPPDTTLSTVRKADADIRKKIKKLDTSKLTDKQKKMLESYMKTGK